MGDMDRLRRLAKELRTQEETTQSLEVASSRQQSMMPEQPVIPGFEMAIVYIPASDVSGDFYDFFETKTGEQGIVIADVTGHGVEAGIIMGMAMATVSIYAQAYDSPMDVLKAANRDLAARLDGKTFVCLSLSFLNPKTKRLRLARAGADRPMLFNPSWDPPEPRDVRTRGLALGLDAGERFNEIIEEFEVVLQPGDVLLQFTDGIVEATNDDKEKEQFGEERIMEILKRYPRASSKQLVFILKEALRDFAQRGKTQAQYDDDVTLIALKAVEPQPVSRKISFT